MKKLVKSAALMGLVLLLVACGGGGGSSGATSSGAANGATNTTTPGGASPTTAVTATPSDLVVSLSSTAVKNGVDNQIGLSVRVLDAGRRSIGDANLNVEISDVPGGSSIAGAVFKTDVNGLFTTSISPGPSKINRTVLVKVTTGSLSQSTAFEVIGTTLAATLVPGNPVPNSSATLTVDVLDSSGSPAANELVSLSGVAGLPTNPVSTNAQGKAVFNILVPPTDGNYTVKVSAAGTSIDKVIQVSTPGSTSIPAAIGPVASPALAANPTVIGANAAGSTTNRTQLKALFFRADNTPVQNMRVRFDIVPGSTGAVLGAGESIVSGTNTVLSDNAGVATTEYVAGARSSPNNGVAVRACYALIDFPATACPSFVVTNFTVAAKPLSLTLGDNNELEKADNNLTYIKRFVLQVADAAGQPVAGAQVSFSVDIYKYGKGSFFADYPSDFILTTPSGATRNIDVTPQDNSLDDVAAGRNSWCVSEDRNRNGILDGVAEDRNGNGSLEPRLADITISSTSPTNKTDGNGVLVIQVRYPQNVATWLAYSVKATASAEGSEGTVTKRYRTSFVEGDERNGSFLDAPYGVSQSCTSPN
jgi:hypothetical protein